MIQECMSGLKSFEEGGGSQPSAETAVERPAWVPPERGVPVYVSIFLLLLMLPALFTVYPVWGSIIHLVLGAVMTILRLFPLPQIVKLCIALVPCVAMFFYAVRFEGVVSQFAFYRGFRVFSRFVWTFMFVVWLLMNNQPPKTSPEIADSASGVALFAGLVAGIAVHFIFRWLDRLFFPVAKEIKKIETLKAKGRSLKRGIAERILYGFLWLIPVGVACQVVINILTGMIMDEATRAQFNKSCGPLVVVIYVVVWSILAFTGILPGTARVKVSAEKLQEQTEAG